MSNTPTYPEPPKHKENTDTLPIKNIEEPILELGDIIQLSAPANNELNDKIFFINYIDNSIIKLIDGNTLDIVTLNIVNGKLSDESIENISILNKPEQKGYSRQNNLVTNTWVDLHFGGDMPTIITGKITNLEEDMIEILTWPDKDVIYIDFGYKGVPIDIPLEKINIRDEPKAEEIQSERVVSPVTDSSKQEITNQEYIQEEGLEEEGKREEGKREEEEEGKEKSPLEKISEKIQTEKIQKENKQLIFDADKIVFGELLEEITQIVDVPEHEKRFSLEVQLNDLLDDLLSTIPTHKRNRKVLNNIHILIERFKQLREEFSKFDEYGNANMVDKKGAAYKPLIKNLEKLNKDLYWILPVVSNKRKIYLNGEIKEEPFEEEDVQEDEEQTKDSVILNLAKVLKEETEIIDQYKNNRTPANVNKYDNLYNELNSYYTPFDNPNNMENKLLTKRVENNLNVVVNNLDDFTSSVYDDTTEGVKNRKYVIEKYNLGLNRLEITKKSSTKLYTKQVPLTQSDQLTLKSFLTLPEQYVRYSHINLPNTSIYDKSNLNLVNMNYWQLLKQNTGIVVNPIDNLNEPFKHENFLKEINEIVLETKERDITKEEVYEKFLNVITPKTRDLFNLVKKYIKNNVSYTKIIEYMEPFMVYGDDITFEPYEEITNYIVNNIKIFKKNLQLSQKEYNYYLNFKSRIKYLGTILFSLLNELIIKAYVINDQMSSSEIIRNILLLDQGRLFNTYMCKQSLDLYSYNDIEDTINKGLADAHDTQEKEQEKDNCKKYVLSKKYIEFDELEEDNKKDIYFDKKYDTTMYDILNEYSKGNMTKDEYILFVTTKLKEVNGLTEEDASYDAISMIEGKKLVKEGQYAVLETYKLNTDMPEMKYYKRINDTWVYDEAITKDVFTDNNKMFCNLQKECLQINEQCLQDNSSIENEKILKNIVKNFENEYFISHEELTNKLEKDLKYYSEIIGKLQDIQTYKTNKYDIIKHQIGLLLEQRNIVVSPHNKLLGLILGQSDFVKKQSDIIKFALKFTREPLITMGENPYFYYCIDTDTALLPTFVIELAESFSVGAYQNTLNRICKDRGALSDSGDAWVDKHSGWTIKQVEASEDEGYTEQGFKVITKSVIQEDVKLEIQKDLSDRDKMIKNVILSISSLIGISIKSDIPFIINEVNHIINTQIGTKEEYKLKQKNKPKSQPYKKILNTYILFVSISYLILCIQTSIPSIKTKKTFPGCVKSFSGFPLGTKADNGAIKYISCVVEKMKSDDKPWSVLKKFNAENIEKNLNVFFKLICEQEEVIHKIKAKHEYLKTTPEEEEIPAKHNITKWKTFLPPLRTIKISGVQSVSKDFKTELENDIVKGNKDQQDKIFMLISKLIYFSFAIQQSIQGVVNKENILLKSNLDEPFLQNACCNIGEKHTINYFIDKEQNISLYNERGADLMKMFYKYVTLVKSPMLYSTKNTKLEYPEIGTDYSDETIYRAFIYYCKFNQHVPLDDKLLSICISNTSDFKKTDSIEEKIKILKREGRNYSQSNLLNLLDIIQKENSVDIDLYKPLVTETEQLDNILTHLSRKKTIQTDTEFMKFIDFLNDFNNANAEELDKKQDLLRDFLLTQNEQMKEKILEFLNDFQIKRNMRHSEEFLKNIKEWSSMESTDTLDSNEEKAYKLQEFLKNTIVQINKIYPNIILNKVSYKEVVVPKYLKLSENHILDIQNIIHKELTTLEQFYSLENLDTILKNIQNKSKDILLILEHLPFYDYIITKDLYSYLFLFSLQQYLHIFKTEEAIGSTEELEETEELTISLDIIGNIEVKKHISKLLISYMDIFAHRKNKVLNWNKKTIQEKVYREKEDEKKQFLKAFETENDEERLTENTLKNLKLGKYSKGITKGLVEYAVDVYDEERQEIIEREDALDVDQQEAIAMSHIPEEGEYDSFEY